MTGHVSSRAESVASCEQRLRAWSAGRQRSLVRALRPVDRPGPGDPTSRRAGRPTLTEDDNTQCTQARAPSLCRCSRKTVLGVTGCPSKNVHGTSAESLRRTRQGHTTGVCHCRRPNRLPDLVNADSLKD